MSLKRICVCMTFLTLACTCTVWGETYDLDATPSPRLTSPGSPVSYQGSRNDHSQGAMLPAAMTNSELLDAVLSSTPRMVRIALERGADPNSWVDISIFGKFNATHLAARFGDSQILSLLIRGGADVDLADGSGRTPLHMAAKAGFLEAAGLLLSNGAKVDSKNHWGRTPLMMAAKNGRSDMARFLIKNGAQVHLTDVNGKTAIDWARSSGYDDVETIMQGRDRSSSARRDNGPPFGTPRSFNESKPPPKDRTAASKLLIKSVQTGSFLEVKKALNAGADVNFQDRNGRTALMFAAQGGRAQIVEWLLSNKANPALKDKRGCTALFHAAEPGRTKAVAILLAGGVEINCANNGRCTPLMMAARNGRHEMVRLLIQKGATVSAEDNMGMTARMLAERAGFRDIAELLSAHEGRPAKHLLQESSPRDGGASSHLIPKE